MRSVSFTCVGCSSLAPLTTFDLLLGFQRKVGHRKDHLSLKGRDQNNWEHTCGWVEAKKNYGHPVPDASSHCEGTQRQEEEKHAWAMFGQFVRLGVPSCFTLCSKVNACECAAEQGGVGRGRGCMWKCRLETNIQRHS